MERVMLSVSNTLEELSILASINKIVSINVNLLMEVGSEGYALLVSSQANFLNLRDEAVVSR